MSKRDKAGFGRPKPTRAPRQQVLIACEGEKTEREYFVALSQTLRLTQVVILIPHEATDPRRIVEQAKVERKRREAAKNWLAESSAWAVYDGDEHIANAPQNWNDAIQIAKSNGINLAISNPCFEFWYLLHFQNHTAYLTRQQALRELEKHIPNYTKAMRVYPHKLDAQATREAIERARNLAKRAEENSLGTYENPCTHVSELVHLLFTLSETLYPSEENQ